MYVPYGFGNVTKYNDNMNQIDDLLKILNI